MPRICPPQERAIYAASFPNAIKVIQKINIKYNTRKNPPLPTPKGKKKRGHKHVTISGQQKQLHPIITLVSNKTNKKPATSVSPNFMCLLTPPRTGDHQAPKIMKKTAEGLHGEVESKFPATIKHMTNDKTRYRKY